MHKKDATELLKELGLIVQENKVDLEDADKDIVVEANPEPGSVVQPGEVVTLTVSTGREPDEDDNSGPGNSEGRGKGNGDDD
jgi:beta-lactam-binding protein with PASTA domain